MSKPPGYSFGLASFVVERTLRAVVTSIPQKRTRTGLRASHFFVAPFLCDCLCPGGTFFAGADLLGGTTFFALVPAQEGFFDPSRCATCCLFWIRPFASAAPSLPPAPARQVFPRLSDPGLVQAITSPHRRNGGP